MTKPALGRGLGSLIPQRKSLTEDVLPNAKAQVLDISLEEIIPNPRQPRTFFSESELEDLLHSIKEHGVLMPIVVTQVQGQYELIAGERRLRACKMLGLSSIPAIVREANEQQKLELALIENIQRQDLNVMEEAIAFRALLDEFNLTQEVVAQRVGKSRSAIANTVRLLDLPLFIQEALRDGSITKSHARTLLAEVDPEKQKKLFQSMVEGKISVRVAERATKKRQTHLKTDQFLDPNLAEYIKQLRDILGTKITLDGSMDRGRLCIDFYSKEEFLKIIDQICHE
jgi:ParB family chromosome partitioning protein